MAEDLLVGFRSFEFRANDEILNIANDAAVLAASDHLFKEVSHGKASEHLGNAREAVQEAILRKAGLDVDRQDEVDTFHFTENFDL